MKEVTILTQFAKKMIKEKNFIKAKQALLKALLYDECSENVFLLLGNVFYLLNKKNSSFNAYLAYSHLHMRRLKQLEDTVLKSIIDVKYNNLSDELKSTLPCKSAVMIYDDNLLTSSISHSFIDLTGDISDPILQECIDLYRDSLIKQVNVKDLIKYSNICYEDYISFTKSHYIELGIELIITNIKWDSIDSNDVKTLYFT